jgi:hypothetical protein
MSETIHPIIEKLWQAELKYNRYCSGYVFIAYREEDEPASYAINKYNYKLNSKCDGWFRKIGGVSNGYGLAINSIKITSRQPQLIGDFLTYKCTIQHIDCDTEEAITDKFWLFVHRHFNVEEVLDYIEQNQHKWYP